jgi:hypothetical protein
LRTRIEGKRFFSGVLGKLNRCMVPRGKWMSRFNDRRTSTYGGERERGIGACRCIGSSAQFNHTQINLYMPRQIAAPCNFWPAPAARGGKLKLIHQPRALQYWRSMSSRAPIHQCSNGANLKRILYLSFNYYLFQRI